MISGTRTIDIEGLWLSLGLGYIDDLRIILSIINRIRLFHPSNNRFLFVSDDERCDIGNTHYGCRGTLVVSGLLPTVSIHLQLFQVKLWVQIIDTYFENIDF